MRRRRILGGGGVSDNDDGDDETDDSDLDEPGWRITREMMDRVDLSDRSIALSICRSVALCSVALSLHP